MKQESNIAPIPFSITPDAKDYLLNRLNEMPPQARPVLMMTEGQTDGLHPPRWSYEGISFVLGYLDDSENSQGKYSQRELLGRHVAIESTALKHLSGRTLSLRRVAASRGLAKISRYVLVTDFAPAPTDSFEQIKRVFSITALTVLGGFTGMGVTWVISALIVIILNISFEKLYSVMFPLFLIGWIAGAITSFYLFKSVFKTNGRTKFVQEQKQKKYLGYGGLDAEFNWWIFLGIPIPLTGILILAIEPLARTVGEKSGIAVGAIVVMFATAMYFCDKLPQRLVFRLGILGWVSTFALGFWYFKTYGP